MFTEIVIVVFQRLPDARRWKRILVDLPPHGHTDNHHTIWYPGPRQLGGVATTKALMAVDCTPVTNDGDAGAKGPLLSVTIGVPDRCPGTPQQHLGPSERLVTAK